MGQPNLCNAIQPGKTVRRTGPSVHQVAMIWLEFATIGLLAGFAAGYLGIGGGLILVPALSWLFSRDPATADLAVHMAVATSLSTMLVTSLSSIIAHHRHRGIHWGLTRQLAPGLVLGALAGALIADWLSMRALAAVFGVYALGAGLQLITSAEARGEKPLPGPAGLSGVGLVIGAVSSLVGIGGGSMTVPYLLWHGTRAQRAVATAAACGYPIALAGTAAFIWLGQDLETGGWHLGYVHPRAFLGVVAFSVLAAPLGAAAVHRSPPVVVRRIFGAFLLAVAVRMFL
jgi:uncharacterized membrane protein YfcA